MSQAFFFFYLSFDGEEMKCIVCGEQARNIEYRGSIYAAFCDKHYDQKNSN
jgi:hypothetical protein